MSRPPLPAVGDADAPAPRSLAAGTAGRAAALGHLAWGLLGRSRTALALMGLTMALAALLISAGVHIWQGAPGAYEGLHALTGAPHAWFAVPDHPRREQAAAAITRHPAVAAETGRLPAAALAMILAAKKERRAAVAGFMLSAAFTSFLTGITEPLEYAFMFLAPVLYVFHALLTAISLAVAYLLEIRHGFFFSAGAIDYILNMGLAEKGWWLIPVGAVFFTLYFLVFYFSIKAFNIKTMGRESEGEAAQSGGFSVFDEYQLAPE
ncbi:MAG: PTS transporter subunit EIIC, partial [Limnochordales bacterium]